MSTPNRAACFVLLGLLGLCLLATMGDGASRQGRPAQRKPARKPPATRRPVVPPMRRPVVPPMRRPVRPTSRPPKGTIRSTVATGATTRPRGSLIDEVEDFVNSHLGKKNDDSQPPDEYYENSAASLCTTFNILFTTGWVLAFCLV